MCDLSSEGAAALPVSPAQQFFSLALFFFFSHNGAFMIPVGAFLKVKPTINAARLCNSVVSDSG